MLVSEHMTPESAISVAQQSADVRLLVKFAHPAPPQAPHAATQQTSKDVDSTPEIPPVHVGPAVKRKKKQEQQHCRQWES